MSKIYDSEYQIQQDILTKVGGDGNKCFDSQYSILLEILDKIEGGGGGGAVINDNVISTTTAWSSSKIVSELADAGFDVEIVTELPTTGNAHTIYFMASTSSQTGNVYDEWMYINNSWEQVGSTAVDLSNYYTKSEADASINAALANYATTDDISTFVTSTDLNTTLADYATITNVDASLANKANISYVDTNFAKLSVLTQAQYEALTTKDSSTLYIISDAQ